MEAAISKMIRREYKFSEAQVGFQPKKGTERAILRYMAATRKDRRVKDSTGSKSSLRTGFLETP